MMKVEETLTAYSGPITMTSKSALKALVLIWYKVPKVGRTVRHAP